MHKKQRRTSGKDSGVSEAIGFIIIFAIIIAGIGIVTLYGYPMLLQQQSTSNEQIMEKNMIVLQNDLKLVAYKTVPYTETSLNVGGGALTVYNMTYDNTTESSFSVYSDDANPATCIMNFNGNCATSGSPLQFWSGDLRYESMSSQTELSLENGAVVKRMLAENGSTMLATPRWYYDGQTNTVVIYLIGFITPTTDIMSQAGVGTVGMNLWLNNYSLYTLPAGNMVYVSYNQNTNADYSDAWDNYFTGTLNLVPGPSAGVYEWPINAIEPTEVVIYNYQVAMEFK